MFNREIASYIDKIRKEFSVVALFGPRQSGKTTLARMLFPDYSYVNFEHESTLNAAQSDLDGFMRLNPAPIIFDEVQRFPKILNEIQVWVDAHPNEKAAYVLTGSNQPELRGAVSESLAGRVALAYLLPLSFAEVRPLLGESRAVPIFKGFMPRVYSENASPDLLYENYLSTYVQRDVNQLVNLKDVSRFMTFLRLLAARVGQMISYDSLANEVGVSATTVKDWLSVLEASFVVFRLQPYYRNFGKRFVKTPKIYFTEVGLAAHLLGFQSAEQIERDTLFGGLFENMVVANIRKNRFNCGIVQGGTAGMFFMRDSNGNEVDVVLEDGRDIDLVEIKSAISFNEDYAKGILKYAKLVPEFRRGTVVYAGTPASVAGIDFVNFMAI